MICNIGSCDRSVKLRGGRFRVVLKELAEWYRYRYGTSTIGEVEMECWKLHITSKNIAVDLGEDNRLVRTATSRTIFGSTKVMFHKFDH